MTQQGARDSYAYVEKWWGEELTPSLVDRIENAPMKQLRQFYEEWPLYEDLFEGQQLETVPSGELRPTFGDWTDKRTQRTVSLRMLLYAHKIVADVGLIHPVDLFPGINQRLRRRDVQESMMWLAHVRPLVMNGSLLFSSKARGAHPSFAADVFRRLAQIPESANVYYSSVDAVPGGLNGSAISGNLQLATEGVATPLALSTAEEVAYRHLLTGHAVDRRTSRLSTLARLSVPDYRAGASELVRIRQNDETFGRWRSDLMLALSTVEAMPNGEMAAKEAAGIVSNALEDSLARVKKGSAASDVLSGLRAGSKGFVLGGLGAVAGVAVAGDPAGLVGGSVASGGDLVWEYLAAAMGRRKKNAVWDVVMSFRPED